MRGGDGLSSQLMGVDTVGNLLERAIRRFENAGIEDARRNAEWLLGDVLARNRAGLYASASAGVAPEAAARFEGMVRRRLRREPLQYVLGYTEFYGLRLQVTPDVLIPRPETEAVVETALRLIRDVEQPRVLDVGTGSGCIALAIKAARSDADVIACDVSQAALEVAGRNAEQCGLSVTFFWADVLREEFAHEAPAELDMLISNPPYIAEEEASELPDDVHRFEPHLALFAREDPLGYYRRLARHGGRLIREGGWIVLECHTDRTREVADILRDAGFGEVEERRDLAGRDRIVLGRIVRGGSAA